MKFIALFFVLYCANFAYAIEPIVLVHGGARTVAARRVSINLDFFFGFVIIKPLQIT